VISTETPSVSYSTLTATRILHPPTLPLLTLIFSALLSIVIWETKSLRVIFIKKLHQSIGTFEDLFFDVFIEWSDLFLGLEEVL
jgi:hypothetical protein